MNYYNRHTLDLFYEADKYGLPYFGEKQYLNMTKAIEDVSFDDLVMVFALNQPMAQPKQQERYLTGLANPEVNMPSFMEGILIRSSCMLVFLEQAIDILRIPTNWTKEKAFEIIDLMKTNESEELQNLLSEYCSGAIRNPYYYEWFNLYTKRGSMADIWNYLIKYAPHLVSYKHSFSCTLKAYQQAYTITHK